MANDMHNLLGEKVYHSIGHLSGSRVGPGDHTIDPGTQRFFTDITTWGGPRERIVIQEKLDGTCVSVIREGDRIIPALRSGHEANTSQYEQHHRFDAWVRMVERYGFLELLRPGERVCGEWLAQAHGIHYDRLPGFFFAFDIRSGDRWLPTLEIMQRCQNAGIAYVPLLYYGPPISIDVIKRLTNRSAYRAKGSAEGVVLRREYGGRRVDIAKFVRQDHRAGIYLPGTSEAVVEEPVWHEVRHEIWRQEGKPNA